MQKNQLIIAMLLFLLPQFLFAAPTTISCGELTGSRLDYFLQNTMDLDNNKFLFGRDTVKNVKPTLLFKDNNELEMQLGNAVYSTSEKGLLQINRLSDNQLMTTFTIIIQNAPVLVTYYKKWQLILLSQHAAWNGDGFEGLRALMVYAKCN